MKKSLKITFIIFVIVLISCISFVGIYVQNKGKFENIIRDYQLGSGLTGSRHITYKIDDTVNDTVYDAEGNVIEDTEENRALEGARVESIAVNPQEVLTEENYEKCKDIIQNRLELMGVPYYSISLNKENGDISIELPEDTNTDVTSQYLKYTGEFKITDSEDENNVLLTNDDIKDVKVGYRTETEGIVVYLNMEFNKEGKEKLSNISKTYISTTDSEGNQTEKEISMYINGTEFMTTYFGTPIEDGILQLQMGQAGSDEVSQYLYETSNIAVLLNSGKLPIQYGELSENRYIYAEENTKLDNKIMLGICIVIIIITFIILIVKFKISGIYTIFENIGFIALTLLAIRYTNVVLTREGIIALGLLYIINYIITYKLTKVARLDLEYDDKSKKYYKIANAEYFKLLPILIIAVVLCFAKIEALYSFGNVLFWGIVISVLTSYTIQKWLTINKKKEVKQ